MLDDHFKYIHPFACKFGVLVNSLSFLVCSPDTLKNDCVLKLDRLFLLGKLSLPFEPLFEILVLLFVDNCHLFVSILKVCEPSPRYNDYSSLLPLLSSFFRKDTILISESLALGPKHLDTLTSDSTAPSLLNVPGHDDLSHSADLVSDASFYSTKKLQVLLIQGFQVVHSDSPS